MFIGLLSKSVRKGEISLLGNEDEPIFRGYGLPEESGKSPDFSRQCLGLVQGNSRVTI